MKDWWHKELKRMHDEVDRLRKARTVYIQRHQEWERCRDAARIAEQGAEIGATGENKVILGTGGTGGGLVFQWWWFCYSLTYSNIISC